MSDTVACHECGEDIELEYVDICDVCWQCFCDECWMLHTHEERRDMYDPNTTPPDESIEPEDAPLLIVLSGED